MESPTPTPSPVSTELRLAELSTQQVLVELVLIAILVVVAALVFGIVLIRAANRSASVLVTVALVWLTLASLGAWAATRQPEALTLAATGLGAIAGAVSAVYRSTTEAAGDSDTTPLP